MATLLSDVFTDTDGVDLSSHTPGTNIPASTYSLERMLTGWSAPTANSVEIQSNQLDIDVSGDGFVYDVKVTDYTIEFDWVISSTTGHRIGIYFRRQDLDNCYYWNLREPNDDWSLYRYTAGVQTQIGTTEPYTFNTSTTYAIKVVVSGTSTSLYINTVLQATLTCDQFTSATKMGIGAQAIATPNKFDNLVISNTPTLTMDDVVPGTATTFTLTGFPIAPTGALVNGQTEAITGGATTSGGTVVAIPLADFAPAQAHVATQWNTNVTARVSIGSFYAEDTVQVTPPVTEHYGALISGFDAANVPGAAAIGDYLYIDAALVDVVADYELAFVQGQTFPLTIPFMLWDVSAGAWLDPVNYEITGESLNFIFYDAFTDTNGTVPASHTPDIDEYGEGWSAVEKEETATPTPSGSVTIQSNELSIGGDYRGISTSVGNPEHVARAYWRVAATDDALSFNFARVDADNHVTAWLRQGGNYSLIQHHNGADAGGAMTGSTTFTVGETYLIEVERDSDNVAYLTIDGLLRLVYPLPHAVSGLAYRIGLYSNANTTYIPAFAINSEIPEIGVDPVLSFDDATPEPGGTVVGTISPVLAGAVTSVTLNGDAIAFSSATTAGATFSIMALAQFVAGGTGVNNPWYENLPVVMSDGTTSVTATLQINAPVPDNYGVVAPPPWGYPNTGAQEGDASYGHLVTGAGMFTPESFDFSESEDSSIYYLCFSVATQSWLPLRTGSFPPGAIIYRLQFSISIGV